LSVKFFPEILDFLNTIFMLFLTSSDDDVIVTCMGLCVTYTRVLDWMIGFINILFTVFETIGKRELSLFPHFTVHRYTRTRILILHYPYPGNGFITVSLLLQITHEASFAQPNSFLAIILQLSIPKTLLNSIHLLPSSYPGRLASRNSADSSQLNSSL
jgi:hypothetical protein